MSNDPELIKSFQEAAGFSPLRRALGGKAMASALVDIPPESPSRLRGVPLAVRMLTDEERALAHAAALTWVRSVAGFTSEYVHSPHGGEELEVEIAVQTLALALVDPSTQSPVAKDADDIRKTLTSQEVVFLYERWHDLVQERSPLQKKNHDELMEELDAMGKGTIPLSSLNGYDSASLRIIVRELVGRHARQMSGSSSDTSPSPESTQT